MSGRIEWTGIMDTRLRIMWSRLSAVEIGRKLGVDNKSVLERAKMFGLAPPSLAIPHEPSEIEWSMCASVVAERLGVTPESVLGGDRHKIPCRARWLAWRECLALSPRYSVAGLARVSGFNHTTILAAFKKMDRGAGPWAHAGGARPEVVA